MYIVNLSEVKLTDIDLVGGKNASLGEMLQNLTELGVNIPGGFALTVNAYKEFISDPLYCGNEPSWLRTGLEYI